MLVPLQDSDEAHYLCGILNSTIVRAIAASYMVEVEIGTHILSHISVKKFDRNNHLHVKISSLSKNAHEISKSIFADDLPSRAEELHLIEDALDKTVAELYGITHEELVEIKKLYSILAGEEVDVEDEEEPEALEEPYIAFTKTALTPFIEDIISFTVINPYPQMLLLTIKLPNQQIITKQVEQGEHYLEIPLGPLPKGVYDIEYQLMLSGQTIKKDTIQITVTEPRRYRG